MKIIKVTGSNNELSLKLAHPLFLDENINYKIGVFGFYSDNNICNIDKDLIISFKVKDITKTINLQKGFWSVSEIDNFVKKELANDKFYVKTNNDKRIEIFSPYPFDLHNDLRYILGFEIPDENEIVTSFKSDQTHVGKFLPKLRPFNVIELHCNLVESCLTNHSLNEHVHEETDLLYSFFPNVSFGSKISEKPAEILYVPIRKDIRRIQKIDLSIRNERHELLKNENVNNIIYLSLIHDN